MINRETERRRVSVRLEIGKIPAARSNISNAASRQTLQKAGLLPCCRLLVGEVVK